MISWLETSRAPAYYWRFLLVMLSVIAVIAMLVAYFPDPWLDLAVGIPLGVVGLALGVYCEERRRN